MSFGRSTSVPNVPTLPQGEVVATYTTYLEAQRAVDYLSDQQFPVQKVTIVGSDLRMVERVTGRLTYPKAAGAGIASGAWFGLFVGLLMSLFGGQGTEFSVIVAMLIGAGFGMLFSVLSYMAARRRRDFTSSSQIVAGTYVVLCLREQSGEAKRLLAAGGHAGQPASARSQGDARVTGDAQRPGPPSTSPQFLDEHGRPRYGVRLEDAPGGASGSGTQENAAPSAAPSGETPGQGTASGEGTEKPEGTAGDDEAGSSPTHPAP